MRAILAYMMAPISPSNGRSVAENIATAKAWLHFLRMLTRDMRFGPHQLSITIAAPYIAAIEAGADEASADDREHGLRDDCAIVERFDLVIAVGHTPNDQLTTGMRLERSACEGPLVYLMDIGRRHARTTEGTALLWRHATWLRTMQAADRDEIAGRIRAAVGLLL